MYHSKLECEIDKHFLAWIRNNMFPTGSVYWQATCSCEWCAVSTTHFMVHHRLTDMNMILIPWGFMFYCASNKRRFLWEPYKIPREHIGFCAVSFPTQVMVEPQRCFRLDTICITLISCPPPWLWCQHICIAPRETALYCILVAVMSCIRSLSHVTLMTIDCLRSVTFKYWHIAHIEK